MMKFEKIMFSFFIAVLFSVMTACNDDRYPTVKIGNQVWMSKNMNVEIEGSHCYKKDPLNCEKYGRLYTWEAAMKVCPDGWHLPSKEEWENLLLPMASNVTKHYRLTSYENAGIKLKSTTGWKKKKNGTDDYGLSALPAGERDFAGYTYIKRSAHFWSATEINPHLKNDIKDAYSVELYLQNGGVKESHEFEEMSVRCIQN